MTTTVEQPTASERECPRCGSAAGTHQEYCLECGARLPPDGAAAGRTAWVWPVALTAAIAFLAAGIIVAIQLTTDEERGVLVATTAPPTLPPTTAEPVPTDTLPTPPEPTVTEPVPTVAAPPQRPRVIEWPQGTRGWTVVLASIPAAQGRPAAVARARDAADAGLTEVGVLRSDEFSSLHPGYLVVFAGVYDTQAQADQARAGARERGFDNTYPREIAP